MNPLAVAVERTVARSPKDRASLNRTFDDELSRVEFAPDAEAVVLPVPLSAAKNWAAGEVTDLELILSLNQSTEAIWFACLPNRRTYYAALEQARILFWRGAKALIARTKNPIVAKHLARVGCRPVLCGEPGGNRWFGGEDALKNWLRIVT